MKKLTYLIPALAVIVLVISCCETGKKDVAAAPQTQPAVEFRDYGPEPFVMDIEQFTLQNDLYRTTVWTGSYLQMTLMSINPGEDIGLEMHPDIDQFLRIEAGTGMVVMGPAKDSLDFQSPVEDDFAIFIPAGKWHNVINNGNEPLKIYSIYSPPEHPFGTVHKTYQEGMEN